MWCDGCALRTRAECECIAHALQGMCDVGGTGAFDQISRAAMLKGLMNVEGGGQAIPSSDHLPRFLWHDSFRRVRREGDPLMPLLFSLGQQHAALQAIDSDLNQFLFAFLDDVYIVTTADRVGEVYNSLNKHLWDFSRISIDAGSRVAIGSVRDQSPRHPFGALCFRGGTSQQEGQKTSIPS